MRRSIQRRVGYPLYLLLLNSKTEPLKALPQYGVKDYPLQIGGLI
jgi:hypothetical protein